MRESRREILASKYSWLIPHQSRPPRSGSSDVTASQDTASQRPRPYQPSPIKNQNPFALARPTRAIHHEAGHHPPLACWIRLPRARVANLSRRWTVGSAHVPAWWHHLLPRGALSLALTLRAPSLHCNAAPRKHAPLLLAGLAGERSDALDRRLPGSARRLQPGCPCTASSLSNFGDSLQLTVLWQITYGLSVNSLTAPITGWWSSAGHVGCGFYSEST